MSLLKTLLIALVILVGILVACHQIRQAEACEATGGRAVRGVDKVVECIHEAK